MSGGSKTNKSNCGPGCAAKAYLFIYNGCQVLGWSYLLSQMVLHYVNGGTTSNLWESIKLPIIIFQNAAILEVVNIVLGLVRSNVMITAAQVASRVIVVLVPWILIPIGRETIGLPLCLLAWSITEIVRYSMYALSIIGSAPYILVWARYTFFYFLYPIGITGELLCYYSTLDYVAKNKVMSYELPNSWNFSFSMHFMLILTMLLYIPAFPQLYYHMIVQRRKVIGQGPSKKHD